jgi:hypothetical protein
VGTFCWATGLQTSVGYLYIRLKTETCFNSGYPTGYPRAGQNTRARTRLGSGRVRVRPAGEKSCPCPSPSGRVPGGYPLPVPELPSLTIAHMVLVHERTTLSLDALVTAHVLIVVTVYRVGLVFPLEGPSPTLSRDIWTVHVFPIVVHVPLGQVARCKGL